MILRILLLALLGAAALAPATPGSAEPVRFRIEPDSSQLTFKATSFLVNADGRFHRLGGEIAVDPADLRTARITVAVEAASIDTEIRRRDNHLRSEDFFHVERFPWIRFESRTVEAAGRELVVRGRLTVRDVTREITVPVQVEVTAGQLTARGEFEINRHDYGISYQSFLNPIGEIVRIAFTFRARALGGG